MQHEPIQPGPLPAHWWPIVALLAMDERDDMEKSLGYWPMYPPTFGPPERHPDDVLTWERDELAGDDQAPESNG